MKQAAKNIGILILFLDKKQCAEVSKKWVKIIDNIYRTGLDWIEKRLAY